MSLSDSGENAESVLAWTLSMPNLRKLLSSITLNFAIAAPLLSSPVNQGEVSLASNAANITWANFKGRRDLDILLEGDPSLFNPYSSILVNPAKPPQIKAADAKIWHDWITSPSGQSAIESFKIDGKQLFFLPGSNPET
jgi:tungstate transport system substrate-binding protein